MASQVERALLDAAAVLEANEAPFAIVGGLAVAEHAGARATEDVDFVVAVEPAAADQLVHSFQQAGYGVASVLLKQGSEELAAVRLAHPGTRVLIDLLVRFCGIEREVVRGARPAATPAFKELRVASSGHLVAMKLLANRAIDRVDLERLLRLLSRAELKRALTAVSTMVSQGLGDGRDLPAELRSTLAGLSSEIPRGFREEKGTAARRNRPTKRVP